MKIGYIIPFYKGEEFIIDAIASCLWQENIDFETEIIVVNDSPGTYFACPSDIANEFYVLVNEKNMGQNYSKNKAVAYAKALGCTHVFSLDQDNVLPPKLISELVANLGEYHAISPGKLVFFAHPGESEKMIEPDTFNPPSNASWDFEYDVCDFQRMISDFKVPPSGGQYLYSIKAWEAAEGYPPQDVDDHGDWGFGFRHVARGYPIKILTGTHYWHRTHSQSMTKTMDFKKWQQVGCNNVLREFVHLLDRKSYNYVMSGKFSGYELIDKKRLRCR